MKKVSFLLPVVFCFMISCQDKQTIDELAKFKQAETLKATNIELAKKFYKHLDAVQLDSITALCVPDMKGYYESGEPASFSDMEPFIKMFYTSFPDYKHEIEDIIAADDKVVCRISFTGTSTNPFMGMSPSGEKFRYVGIQIFQFANSKVTNFWAVEDELGLMMQLGLELRPIDK
jgi:predicted ester cyclase